jgi:hypothetical protein
MHLHNGDLFGQFAVDSPYATEWVSRGWADRETLEKIHTALQGWEDNLTPS